MKVYVDGSANGNDCAYCVYILKEGSKKKRICKILKKGYNVYQIEYMALIEGLNLCDENSTIFSDCRQVVNEVNLEKNNIKDTELFIEATDLMKLKNAKVVKVPRDKNLAGIYLEQRLFKIKKDFKEVLKPFAKKRSLTKKEKYQKYVGGRKNGA